jgi:transposase
MITLPPAIRVFIATKPADLRKSFAPCCAILAHGASAASAADDGLSALVREFIKEDPLSGHLFVFRNKKAHSAKILFWDRTGFCIWYKRLEQGTFRFPKAETAGVEISAAELTLLLEGIDLAGATRQKRFVKSI